MIDYDSFSRCHLTDIFFVIHAGAKELNPKILNFKLRNNQVVYDLTLQNHFTSIRLRFVISIKQEDCISLTDYW